MSRSQKDGCPCVKYCQHCRKPFEPNKFNAKRQKFCTRAECKRQRNIIRSRKFRENNPDYFKKSPSQTYRTKIYNDQRDQKRKLESLANRVVSKQKRVFVDQTKTLASLLEFFLFTFLGMTSFASGGLRQTSAFNLSNLLSLYYKDGVSLINADVNLKHKLEILYEFVTQSDQSFESEKLAEILQLAGSPPRSRGLFEEVEQ